MSAIALAVLVSHVVIYGFIREADEGTAAHLWQILMGGQLPIIAFFVIKWLPQNPKEALKILVVQIFSALAAMAPVFYFKM